MDIGIEYCAKAFCGGRLLIKEKADIVTYSALLTTTMRNLKLLKTFEDAGVREQFKIMIGGHDTQDFLR